MSDQDETAHQQNLLQIHRRNLEHLVRQASSYGGEDAAPIHIVNQIESVRDNIRRIKTYLRGRGVTVEDQLNDEPPAAPPAPTPPKPQPNPELRQPQAAKPKRNSRAGPDVYISYNKADRAWVRDELLPLIEGAGLKALVDWRDFEIGVPKLVNMEQAVERARHTLVVITPEWLADDWNGFQSMLAGSEDPAGMQQKLIPIILKQAKIPSRIGFLQAVDLTVPTERKFELERLLLTLAKASGRAKPRRAAEAGKQLGDASASPSRAAETSPAQAQSRQHTPVDFVIVTALEEEREAVLKKLPGYQKHSPSDEDIRFYYSANIPVTADGTRGNYRVIVLSLLGMGRVQAATATGDAIRQWHPRYVMLVGIAGGLASAGVKLGDVLISDQIADYELQRLASDGPVIRWQTHNVDPRLIGAVQNFGTAGWQDLIAAERPDDRAPKRHIGTIVTGDKVIAVEDVLARYSAIWPKLIGVEMEAGGSAAAAFQSADSPGFFMVRGVSDLADSKKNSARVKKWRPYACDVAAAYAIALLQSGPVPVERQ